MWTTEKTTATRRILSRKKPDEMLPISWPLRFTEVAV